MRAASTTASTIRSKRVSLVPTETKITAPRTVPLYRAPSTRLGELGPLHVHAARDRVDQAPAERQPLDPRHALDVDDARTVEPREPGERDRDAGAGGEDRERPGRRAATRRASARLRNEVLDAAVRRAEGPLHVLAFEQRAGVGPVERHPGVRKRAPGVLERRGAGADAPRTSRRAAAGVLRAHRTHMWMIPLAYARDPSEGLGVGPQQCRLDGCPTAPGIGHDYPIE